MMEVLITFIVVAVIAIFILRILGWVIGPFIGNIIAGGLLYWVIDAFLIPMKYGFLDAIIVAFFGVPGTLFLAFWTWL